MESIIKREDKQFGQYTVGHIKSDHWVKFSVVSGWAGKYFDKYISQQGSQVWKEKGEEDEAVGESVAHGVWSHEARVSCPGPTTLLWSQRKGSYGQGLARCLDFSSCEWNIASHCWMKATRWMAIGNLREATVIGWNWGRRVFKSIFNCWKGAQTNKPVRLQWPITDTIPTTQNIWNIWMKCR